MLILALELTNDTTLKWKANQEPDLAGYEQEPDLAGYKIVWRRTTAPLWQHRRKVGDVTRYTLPLSKDNYFFGVRSIDGKGTGARSVFQRRSSSARLSDSSPHLFGLQGHVDMTDAQVAECVDDRILDRRGRANRPRFANSLCPQGIQR